MAKNVLVDAQGQYDLDRVFAITSGLSAADKTGKRRTIAVLHMPGSTVITASDFSAALAQWNPPEVPAAPPAAAGAQGEPAKV